MRRVCTAFPGGVLLTRPLPACRVLETRAWPAFFCSFLLAPSPLIDCHVLVCAVRCFACFRLALLSFTSYAVCVCVCSLTSSCLSCSSGHILTCSFFFCVSWRVLLISLRLSMGLCFVHFLFANLLGDRGLTLLSSFSKLRSLPFLSSLLVVLLASGMLHIVLHSLALVVLRLFLLFLLLLVLITIVMPHGSYCYSCFGLLSIDIVSARFVAALLAHVPGLDKHELRLHG